MPPLHPAPTIETERLLLRPPIAEDFEAWAAFCADPEVMPFLGGVLDRAGAWRNMSIMAGAWTVRGHSVFSVIEKASGRWIGRIGPWQPEGWPGTEIGYAVARDVWGKGYAYEGAFAAADWAFRDLGWREVIHCIAPANKRSQLVASRLGARILRQARLPEPTNYEVDIWGQTREEWLARDRQKSRQ
jgi:RimJ/RimL family protein N-acetyltransferase